MTTPKLPTLDQVAGLFRHFGRPARHPLANPPRQTVQHATLGGLQRREHLYEGTVPAAVVERRRAKNKAARQARRTTRARS